MLPSEVEILASNASDSTPFVRLRTVNQVTIFKFLLHQVLQRWGRNFSKIAVRQRTDVIVL